MSVNGALNGEVQHPSSSCIGAFVYEHETGDLHIQFAQGHTGTYSGVPADVVEGLARAGSKGKYYNRAIKGQYDYEAG